MSMGYAAWRRTPYADTEAKETEKDITRLFEKYSVKAFQFTQGVGPAGRPAWSVRFVFNGRTYKAGLEVLDVHGYAQSLHEQLLRQVKRLIYWRLKTGLEMVGIFSPEQVFFDWLELADGVTAYEAAAPAVAQLPTAAAFAAVVSPQRLLPPGAT